MNFTLYIDESGNTGSRYLDKQQPYYLLGGWLIEDSSIPILEKEILLLEKAYSSNSYEIKGKNLVKHLKGQKFILNVCKTVAKYGGLTLMFLVEKKYMVCAKIVETYLDPAYNKLVKMSELLDLELRQDTAQEIYNTKSNLIEEFAEAYRLRDVNRIKELNSEWSSELLKLGNSELSKKIAGASDNIEEEIAIEFEMFSTNKNFDSLNLPMLGAMFQYIEENLPSPLKIIHDNTDSFKDAYYRLYNLLNNNSEEFVQYKDGRKLYFGLKTITNFSFDDSKLSPLLRASDYSVSSTFEFVKQTFDDDDINDTLSTIALMSIGGIMLRALSEKYPVLDFKLDMGNTYSSKDFVKKLFSNIKPPNA